MSEMELFEYMRRENGKKDSPLASRLRPESIDEVVGQRHIIGKGRLLYRAILADQLRSVILYGPPGTGKTTIAEVIAKSTSADFVRLNATCAGKKDMEAVVDRARQNAGMYGRKTILFIDEIHRFNKGQQDYLLPFVEDGTVILIGATTQNPYFEVNTALLSRSMIFELLPLEAEEIKTLLYRAINDEKKGMGAYHASIDDEALEFLSEAADGDARIALNALELAVLTTKPEGSGAAGEGRVHITLDAARDCVNKKTARYDRDGDNHYDTVSAFIKSMRGSDPDAAVYYLARMLHAGEDINFIARRIVICASEDVGCADPAALNVAVSVALAAERVGMPEARIPLSQAAVYVACAPKSNAAYLAIDRALAAVREQREAPIPLHLRDSHYKGARELRRGVGYKYAHDFPGHYTRQQYLPDAYKDAVFYEPTENGYEEKIRQMLRDRRGE